MKCKIKNKVFQLIEKHSMDELKKMLRATKSMLTVMSFAIPSGEDAEEKRENLKALKSCLEVAIGCIEEYSKLDL